MPPSEPLTQAPAAPGGTGSETQASEDDKPLFYGLTGTSDLVVMDARTGKRQHVEKQIGSTSTLLVNP